jgi:hypothetical protein
MAREQAVLVCWDAIALNSEMAFYFRTHKVMLNYDKYILAIFYFIKIYDHIQHKKKLIVKFKIKIQNKIVIWPGISSNNSIF